MFIGTVDCGTTNTRVYIVDEHGKILGKGARPVGVRDTATSGSVEALRGGIGAALNEALAAAGKTSADLQFVISSGMITSEIGLKELPHLEATVGLEELANGIARVDPLSPFPDGVPVYFIRGIKNKANWDSISRAEVGFLDFMRGEETQAMGVVSQKIAEPPFTIVMLSSHTKFVSVNGDGRVAGSITTLSGQIYAGILAESFIGKSVAAPSGEEAPPIDPAIIEEAYRWTMDGGILRSMMMTRFMDVLLSTEWHERKLFVESAIAASDLKAMDSFSLMGLERDTPYVLIGDHHRCTLYKHLLTAKLGIQRPVSIISDIATVDSLSIRGALAVSARAGIGL